MSQAGDNFQRICTNDRCNSRCTCEIQHLVLKPLSGEKACPSEQQCGEEGWAKVVTRTDNPILNTKCQVKRSNRKLQRFWVCFVLFFSICLSSGSRDYCCVGLFWTWDMALFWYWSTGTELTWYVKPPNMKSKAVMLKFLLWKSCVRIFWSAW